MQIAGWQGEQIIILRMIYAYCLSLFSMHFFSSHSIAQFKIRLINQQTGDCADSIILHAGKLTPSTFPVPIKLKGGQRLLVKVKLLSLGAGSSESLVGEGVVSFDKNSIDNTLRVPIYDKKRGVEEVAICSIDFFLSGFEVDKHTSINHDKSRSHLEDWRERTEDAVYSQMSYTLESERDSAEPSSNRNPPKPIPTTTNTAHAKAAQNTPATHSRVKDEQKKGRRVQSRAAEAKQRSPRAIQHFEEESKESSQAGRERKPANFKPFTLENNVYLDERSPKKNQNDKVTLKQTTKKPNSSLRKNIALDSQEDGYGQRRKELSPDSVRKTVKENQEVLEKLKRYLLSQEKEESPKHKRRRNTIKVEEFPAYHSQNNFVKYHVDFKTAPSKMIKNLRAIRIIESQIKEPNEEKVIPQIIDRVVLNSLDRTKLLTFDAIGFRSYCISTGQSKAMASIMIPTIDNAVNVRVQLGEEGEFEGMIGLQEGESMNVSLARVVAAPEQSILQRSEFKLLFDIKHTDSKPSSKTLKYHNNDISLRQPFELIAPDQDIKTRVSQLSGQPWGFVKSYAEGVILSPASKQVLDRIDQQLPRLKEEIARSKPLSEQKPSHELSPISKRSEIPSKQDEIKSHSASKNYLESPIRKVKPIPPHIRREADSINSIRNGNRNNYRFQERNSSKQIKEAWEQILFKRNVEEERLKQAERQAKHTKKVINISRSRSKPRDNQSNSSENESLSTFKPRKVNKLYQFVQDEGKMPTFPARTFTLKIANVSITQPQALVDSASGMNVGKFVKLAIKGRSIYFTEVIFSGSYNSILWKLEGCVFQELTGHQKLKVQIYETLNNRISTLGISIIRVNRLYFLRKNHIYNGTIQHESNLSGEFTLGFQIDENYPFEVIQEEDEDTINLNQPIPPQKKRVKTLSHQSQKQLLRMAAKPQLKPSKMSMLRESDESQSQRSQLEESLSMPLGLSVQ